MGSKDAQNALTAPQVCRVLRKGGTLFAVLLKKTDDTGPVLCAMGDTAQAGDNSQQNPTADKQFVVDEEYTSPALRNIPLLL